MGCVKVVNDVKFDFDENEAEYFTPPVDILQDFEVQSKAKKGLRGLVLAPTRELAMQVQKHLVNVSKHTGLKVSDTRQVSSIISAARHAVQFSSAHYFT